MIGTDEHGREVYSWWETWALATAPLTLGGGSVSAGAFVALTVVGGAAGVVFVVTQEWPRTPRRRSTDR